MRDAPAEGRLRARTRRRSAAGCGRSRPRRRARSCGRRPGTPARRAVRPRSPCRQATAPCAILQLMAVALDKLARPVRDLRISVTDRCNFRCVYCMPKEVFGKQFEFLRREQLLTFEEIERLTRTFAGDGRREAAHHRRRAARAPRRRRADRPPRRRCRASDDVTLTTNGALLARMAQRLADAGLNRVTVSLDSLDDATFRAMNDVDFPVADVLEGIDAALAAGLAPVKVNMVVKRGTNDDGHPRHGRALPRHRRHPALHRVHGRRRDQRLAARRRRALGRDRERDRRALAARAGRSGLPRRGRRALPLPRRRGRDRPDLVGHAAVLP